MDISFSWCLIQNRRVWESAFPLWIYKYKSFFRNLLFKIAVFGYLLLCVNVNRFLRFADTKSHVWMLVLSVSKHTNSSHFSKTGHTKTPCLGTSTFQGRLFSFSNSFETGDVKMPCLGICMRTVSTVEKESCGAMKSVSFQIAPCYLFTLYVICY